MEIFKNILMVLLIGLPLLLLEIFSDKWKWLEKNKEGIGLILWLLVLGAVYFFILPMLGLSPTCKIHPESAICNF